MQGSWGTASLPGPGGPEHGISTAGGSSLVLFRASRHPDEAWRLIEFLSRAFTLLPGDVILTGTPPGVGHYRTPPRYLRAGDVVTVTKSPLVARFVRLQPRDYFYRTLVARLSTNITRGLL